MLAGEGVRFRFWEIGTGKMPPETAANMSHPGYNRDRIGNIMNMQHLPLIAFLIVFQVSAAFGQSPENTVEPGLERGTFSIPVGGPDDDPEIEIAVQCLADTRVLRFTANPTVVEPFSQTTLSWSVAVPPGCPIALSIAGQRVARAGTLAVTPIHVNSRFGLVASILGARATLASAAVSVDQGTCGDQVIPENLVAPGIVAAIDEFDEQDDDFKQIEPPQIQIQSNGLFIHMVVKADVSLFPDATVTVDMGLRFPVRDGVIAPRYTLFRPRADTALPDDFVESKFFDRSAGILADFKRGFNEAIGDIVADDERLLDLATEPFVLRATICAIELPPQPRLTVRLKVLPAGDPGRFNLRIDGTTRAGNQADGGSTGAQEVGVGVHTVSQTAAGQTKLTNYKSFIGGDCGPDGRVTLSQGDAKTCLISNIAQAVPDQCKKDCADERNQCQKDADTPKEVCVALFRRCVTTCN